MRIIFRAFSEKEKGPAEINAPARKEFDVSADYFCVILAPPLEFFVTFAGVPLYMMRDPPEA